MSPATSNRNAPPWVSAVLLIVAIVALVVAVLYFTETAAKLPAYLPGHLAGSGRHHTKHGVVAAGIGIVALAAAWLSNGEKPSQ